MSECWSQCLVLGLARQQLINFTRLNHMEMRTKSRFVTTKPPPTTYEQYRRQLISWQGADRIVRFGPGRGPLAHGMPCSHRSECGATLTPHHWLCHSESVYINIGCKLVTKICSWFAIILELSNRDYIHRNYRHFHTHHRCLLPCTERQGWRMWTIATTHHRHTFAPIRSAAHMAIVWRASREKRQNQDCRTPP